MHLNTHRCGGPADNLGVIGIGSALPDYVVTNDDLAKFMDTSDEWIRTRTGIGQRHIAVQDTTATLAVKAAQEAIKNAGLTGEDIDVIVCCTITPDYRFPTISCLVQRGIGASGCAAFDISAACSGFVYAYSTAYKFLKAGGYRYAMVVASETLSRVTNWQDRSTAVLFGDGASAVIIGPKEGAGMLSEEIGADGDIAEMIVGDELNDHDYYFQPRMNFETMAEDDPRQFLKPMEANTSPYFSMAGREVYKFATTSIPKSIDRVLEAASINKEEIAMYVLHQANARILTSAAKHMQEDISKFPMSIEDCANTSSSTIPILLDRLVKEGKLKDGDKIVISGFGAGMTWASAALEW